VVIDDLARKVEKTKEVQMAPKLFFEGNYVHMWVIIDVGKSLMCFMSLSIQGKDRKR
jgi:ribosomal silencing factor RsfS